MNLLTVEKKPKKTMFGTHTHTHTKMSFICTTWLQIHKVEENAKWNHQKKNVHTHNIGDSVGPTVWLRYCVSLGCARFVWVVQQATITKTIATKKNINRNLCGTFISYNHGFELDSRHKTGKLIHVYTTHSNTYVFIYVRIVCPIRINFSKWMIHSRVF